MGNDFLLWKTRRFFELCFRTKQVFLVEGWKEERNSGRVFIDLLAGRKVGAQAELSLPQDAHCWVNGLTQRILDSFLSGMFS